MAAVQVPKINTEELLKKVDDLEKRLETKDAEIQIYKVLVSQMEDTVAQSKKYKALHEKQSQDVDNLKSESEKTLTRAKSMIFEKTKVIKNQELQIEAFNQQIESMKDVVRITKELLEIRNLELRQLENKINVIEGKQKAEKERYDLTHKKLDQMIRYNGDLKREYETQLCLFTALRERYNERELAKGLVDNMKADKASSIDDISKAIKSVVGNMDSANSGTVTKSNNEDTPAQSKVTESQQAQPVVDLETVSATDTNIIETKNTDLVVTSSSQNTPVQSEVIKIQQAQIVAEVAPVPVADTNIITDNTPVTKKTDVVVTNSPQSTPAQCEVAGIQQAQVVADLEHVPIADTNSITDNTTETKKTDVVVISSSQNTPAAQSEVTEIRQAQIVTDVEPVPVADTNIITDNTIEKTKNTDVVVTSSSQNTPAQSEVTKIQQVQIVADVKPVPVAETKIITDNTIEKTKNTDVVVTNSSQSTPAKSEVTEIQQAQVVTDVEPVPVADTNITDSTIETKNIDVVVTSSSQNTSAQSEVAGIQQAQIVADIKPVPVAETKIITDNTIEKTKNTDVVVTSSSQSTPAKSEVTEIQQAQVVTNVEPVPVAETKIITDNTIEKTKNTDVVVTSSSQSTPAKSEVTEIQQTQVVTDVEPVPVADTNITDNTIEKTKNTDVVVTSSSQNTPAQSEVTEIQQAQTVPLEAVSGANTNTDVSKNGCTACNEILTPNSISK